MPILDAVQTFVGITNENEFYSHHYSAEVFKGDIKDRLNNWEAEKPNTRVTRSTASQQAPAGLGPTLVLAARPVQRGRDEHERWQAFMPFRLACCKPGLPGAATQQYAARTRPRPAHPRVAFARPAPGGDPGTSLVRKTMTCWTSSSPPSLRRRAPAHRTARPDLGRDVV